MNLLKLDERLNGILNKKTVVITGAGSGLGKAIALGIPFSGANIALIDFNHEAINEIEKKINLEYGKKICFSTNASVTDEEQLLKSYNEIKNTFGEVDILINCAGVAKLGSIENLSAKDIRLSNSVNIDGYFLNASIAAKQMISKKKGSIINISSASARGVSAMSSLYGVAKEAQCMMTREWAMDLGKHGIRVNSLLCGDLFGDEKLGINSGIWNQEYFEKKAVSKELVDKNDPRLNTDKLNPEIRKLVVEYYTKRTALEKEVTYADIVTAIILLCSDLCKNISGESISLTAGNPLTFSR
jgi:NAD(P)-dependent dehydrogenase (short-subunit alcohol dehydrogenase family)